MVRRLNSTCALATAVVVGLLAHGAAAANGLLVDGALVGTSQWSPAVSVFGCTVAGPASRWSVSGTFDARGLGSGAYSGTLTRTAPALCSAVPFSPSEPFPVAGTLTFSGRTGGFVATVLPGSTGTSTDLVHSTDYGFSLELVLSSGTRRFKAITGTLRVLYGTTFTSALGCPCSPSDVGTVIGTLVPRAAS